MTDFKGVSPADVFRDLATRRLVFIGEGDYGCMVTARGVGEVLDGLMQVSAAHRDLCVEAPDAHPDLLCEMERSYGLTPHAVDSCPVDTDALDAAVFDLLDGHGDAALESLMAKRLTAQPDIAANITATTEGRSAVVLYGTAYLGEGGLPGHFPAAERAVVAVFKDMAAVQDYVAGEEKAVWPRLTTELDFLYLAKPKLWLRPL